MIHITKITLSFEDDITIVTNVLSLFANFSCLTMCTSKCCPTWQIAFQMINIIFAEFSDIHPTGAAMQVHLCNCASTFNRKSIQRRNLRRSRFNKWQSFPNGSLIDIRTLFSICSIQFQISPKGQQVEELVICILRHTYLNIHHTLRTKVKYDETIKHHQHIGINIALSLDEDLMICLPWWFFLFELDHFLALIIVFILNTFTF